MPLCTAPLDGRRQRRLVGLLLLGVGGPASMLSAQTASSTDWITREQEAMWVGAFVDQPVTPRVALWFDGSWRRMDLGQRPQQLLLRPGVQITLAPGVRLGGGYGYVASAPYGRLPGPSPLREHRTWQQLALNHAAGPVTVSHRFRLEQRWITPLASGLNDMTRGPSTYQNRFRYQGRGQWPIPGVQLAGRPVLALAWDELLMPLGGPTQRFTLGQNRATAGVGLPLSDRMRVEVAYMNLYNAYPSRRANEVNHTVWLSLHWTGAPVPK